MCVCVCVCVCVKGPSGLGYQLPLLLAPRAKESVLKCLRSGQDAPFFNPGRAGAPEWLTCQD